MIERDKECQPEDAPSRHRSKLSGRGDAVCRAGLIGVAGRSGADRQRTTAGDFLGNCMPDVWRRLGLGDPQTTSRAGTVTTITDGTLTMTITENTDGSVVVERS